MSARDWHRSVGPGARDRVLEVAGQICTEPLDRVGEAEERVVDLAGVVRLATGFRDAVEVDPHQRALVRFERLVHAELVDVVVDGPTCVWAAGRRRDIDDGAAHVDSCVG